MTAGDDRAKAARSAARSKPTQKSSHKSALRLFRNLSLGALTRPLMRPLRAHPRRAIALGLLCLFLLWQILTHSLAAVLAPASPTAALALQPSQPMALMLSAERQLVAATPKVDATNPDAQGADPEDLAAVRTEVERLLTSEPLSATGRRLLAQLAEVEAKDPAQVRTAMDAAVRRSMWDASAVYWMMLNSYEIGDYAAAVRYAEILARSRMDLIAPVSQILTRVAETTEGLPTVQALLAKNPRWRPAFFAYQPTFITDIHSPLDLFSSLRDTAAPVTLSELSQYINFLIARKLYALAYYTWLQFLPPDQLRNAGYLFNGNFEYPLSALPFDWRVSTGSGVTVDTFTRPNEEGEQGLFIEFGQGRVNFGEVSQLVVLAPGTYQFEGRYKGRLLGQRGMIWRVFCLGEPWTMVGQSTMVNSPAPDWKEFDFTFKIPATDCPAQRVQLRLDSRMASEQFISGSIWYNQLRITRTD